MYWVWWLVICFMTVAILSGVLFALLLKRDRKRPHHYWDDNGGTPCVASGVVCAFFLLAGIISIAVGGAGEYRRVHQPIYWAEFTEMVQGVVDSGNAITNRDMTKQIVDYNKWLVDARADQQVKGKWSLWHDIDLSGFSYIDLSNGTEFDITLE